MIPRHDPGFIRHSRRIRTQSQIVSSSFDYTLGLAFFLVNDVAEHAALFAHEVFTSGAQFVENSARHEHGRGQLRRWMAELLSGAFPEILKQTDVLHPWIVFQVEDTFGCEPEKVSDLVVAGVPQVPVVTPVLN